MAKRKRLILSSGGADIDPDMAENVTLGRGTLRPGLGGGAPPIAQVAGDAATRSALAEMSEAMSRARAEGRLVLSLPLAAIEADYLVRDRIETDEEELGHLIASIQTHGQRSPVEVTELAPGRYGLISGWRRIQALTRLSETEGEGRHGTVQALLRRPEAASDAYIAMVEENEVRQGLSYYERARIAARAVDLGVFGSEKQALQRLFAAASRARRSKIGSFLTLYRELDTGLRFPAAIPERLGLALAKWLEGEPGRGASLCAGLIAHPAATAAEEQARLARAVAGKTDSVAAEKDTNTAPDEVSPGVFLGVAGGSKPVLTLSGPGVGPEFQHALLRWLRAAE